MDEDLFPVFYQPMPCYDPNPLIGRAADPGDCEHCRKFLTDLCVQALRLPPECRA